MIELPPETLSQIFKHGEHEYPRECCGIVFLDGVVHPATNIQDQLHARDPRTYPREATRGYTFSFEDLTLLEKSFVTDRPARIVYHSHPDVGAYFSDEDRRKALFCGEPVYPLSYLVVDVRNGRAAGASLFSYVDGDFRCIGTFAANASNP